MFVDIKYSKRKLQFHSQMDFNSWTLSSFGNQSAKKSDVLSQPQLSAKLPKIVLRNSMGFPLKTMTSFQNALYRAKTKLWEPNRRLTEMEWRYTQKVYLFVERFHLS